MKNNLDDITPVIITFNEEANIGRTLAPLGWARDIVVVDSGSTDATLEIARRAPRVRVFHRPFDSPSAQWNFAIGETAVATRWILALDADYVLSNGLVNELSSRDLGEFDAYQARFLFCVNGKALRGALYPPGTVLFLAGRARYAQEGHAERLSVEGRTGMLASKILHDDRKPLSRWFPSQQWKAAWEAGYLLDAKGGLRPQDRIRRMGWPAPILVFLYTLIGKGCLFDGWAGWHYVLQRTLAETMIALEIADRRLRARANIDAEQQ